MKFCCIGCIEISIPRSYAPFFLEIEQNGLVHSMHNGTAAHLIG